MFDKENKIKLIKMTYLPQYHTFDVECIMPDRPTPEVRRWNIRSFPEHKPFKILNGFFRVSQEVRIWIKDEKELRTEGWGEFIPNRKTLGNKNKSFTIGKKKAKLLGGQSIKGFVGLSEKMTPYVVVKDGDKFWRFTEDMLRLVLPLRGDDFNGKNVSMKGTDGMEWVYSHGVINSSAGVFVDASVLTNVIALLRKAEVI